MSVNSSATDQNVKRAANAIRDCSAILIGAGAEMGVDSGLPDFRGSEGFWKAYPAFRGIQFSQISNPVWFTKDPNQAWGFFGHRYNLYKNTVPHRGFSILQRLCKDKPNGHWIFTSNVDGQFQSAGFSEDAVTECHGSIHHLQCCDHCTEEIWAADNLRIEVNESEIRAESPLPSCKNCDGLARPNILMFGDYGWLGSRTEKQETAFRNWLKNASEGSLVAIELGAGTAIPTVRWECERMATTHIRINPRDYEIDEPGISIPLGALEALERIEAAL